jgi:Ca2+:H+ antiporter
MTEPTPPPGQTLGEAARLLVEAAQVEASSLGHPFVGTEHVLLALLADPGLAAIAQERNLPSREDLRARLAAAAAPRALPGADASGLSSQARRLLEGADRSAQEAGAISIDRRAILERIVGNPRGPLGKLLGRDSREAGRATVPDHAMSTEGEERKARGTARKAPEGARKAPDPGRKAAEPGRKGSDAGRKTQGPARPGPEGLRPPSPVPSRPSTPVVIKSRPAFPISVRGLMLLLVPATVVLNAVMHADPLVVFVVACLGVIPLASYMGEATEHLAARTGPAIGGLLNATFGNAAELIIAIVALQAGLVDLVKASITGSILGNLLLIMGLSFVAGGLKRPVLQFNRTSAGASSGMLALAVVGLVFPALFHGLSARPVAGQELRLSEMVAIVLAVTYGFSLLFSLHTHRSLFGGEPHPLGSRAWKPLTAVLVLAVATAGVVIQSEILVHAVEGVTATLGLSQTFLGLIVIPLIGNAAEHATAVVVARKGQMDLSLQIALGSSTQVALLVAPALVLAGVLLNQPMNLVFTTFEVAALGLTTIISAIITLDGESHWFEGVQLLAMYALVAATAYFI